MSTPCLVGSFFGATLRRRRLGRLIASDNLYRPLARLPAHSHERAYVAFVMSGCFHESCGRESVECVPGTAVLHPAREVHANSFTSHGARVFSVELDTERLTAGGEHGRELSRRQVIRGNRVFQLGLQLYLRLVGEDGLADLHVDEFTQALGEEIFRLQRLPARQACSAWMRRAEDFLQAHYAEPLTLALIARHAGVHPIHLARQFRRVHHRTVGDFVRALRLQRATELLLTTDRPISEIAGACGFADQSHLTRLLKASIGAAPCQLRTRLRSRN